MILRTVRDKGSVIVRQVITGQEPDVIVWNLSLSFNLIEKFKDTCFTGFRTNEKGETIAEVSLGTAERFIVNNMVVDWENVIDDAGDPIAFAIDECVHVPGGQLTELANWMIEFVQSRVARKN